MPDSVPFSRPSRIQPSAWSCAQPSAGVDVHGGLAVDEHVVHDLAVPAAADERRAGHLIEHVAGNLRAAVHVVQVHAHAAAALEAVDVVQVVVPDHRAPHRPIAPGIDRAGIVRLEAHVVDFVQLDHVIVAAKADGLVRRVVDQIVGNPVADAVHRNAGAVHRLETAVVMDVVVFGVQPGRCQRLAIAAGKRDPAFSHLIDVAPDDAVGRSRDRDRVASAVADRTADQPVVGTAADDHGRVSHRLEASSRES